MTLAAPEKKPTDADDTTESPQTKRRKQEEEGLSFLQVKNKDGHNCLFVDLGKRNHKCLCVFFYSFYRYIIMVIISQTRCLH